MDDESNFDEVDEEAKPEPVSLIEAQQADYDQDDEMRENQAEMAEAQAYGDYYPSPKEKDSIYSFFRKVLGLKDTTRVANLDKRELGNLQLSVRSNQYLSMVGGILNNKPYSDFFGKQSEIITSTSMAKKGWFTELVVSQKKVSSRNVTPLKLPEPPKKKILGGII